MANKKYEETDIQAIAEAIREKTGSEDSYRVSEMASGVNEVYDRGRADEHLDFWNKYHSPNGVYGARYAFGGGAWRDATFYPPYDLIFVGDSSYAFQYNGVTNLRQRFNELGIKIIFKYCITVGYFFNQAITSELPDMDLNGIKNVTRFVRDCPNLEIIHAMDFSTCQNYEYFAYNCPKLETIEKINFSSATNLSNAFGACPKLANINCEGNIPISISFASSPLTVASLKSIITHLKDYSGTDSENTYTVTFKASAFSALEAEGSTAEYNGVACTWTELIDNLKWNLVKA